MSKPASDTIAASNNVRRLIARMEGDMGQTIPAAHASFIHALSGTESNYGLQLDNARNPSVYGLGHFQRATHNHALEWMRDHGDAQQQSLARKALRMSDNGYRDEYGQAIAIYAHSLQNADTIRSLGKEVTPVTLNVMHIGGSAGGPRLLQASDSASVASVLGGEAARDNPGIFGGTVGQAKYQIGENLRKRGYSDPGAVLNPDTLESTGRSVEYERYDGPIGSGGRGLATRAGEFFGNMGSMVSNWFRDDETGEFSAKKALMSAGALALLAYMAMNGNTWLFIATLIFMLVAGAMVMGSGVSFANPHAPQAPGGRERERQRGREREVDPGIDDGLWHIPDTIEARATMPAVDPSDVAALKGSAPQEAGTHGGMPSLAVTLPPEEGVWRVPTPSR